MAPKKKPTDELKDQRIPIMMSEAELKAIDDWSFDNRIRSRGEAIRRLCQIGIETSKTMEEAWPAAKAFSDAFTAFSFAVEADQAIKRRPKDLFEFIEILHGLGFDLCISTGKLHDANMNLRQGETFQEAKELLEKARATAAQGLGEVDET